ncbi:antitoxin [Wenjunlia tyrosinilytica]|uniref:Kanamycin biosynthetic protein n=1 Tax=Wenjunlia tyrosinilytica TaxID=1544741 RepID=A0A917ZUY4_9ACTN|nr:antitoxin [Wenjunlia tyrosinilytica]GGO91490.1 kanamycin biosynthetic protein [Wenjunlia tyrosinilytica]
MGFMDKVKEMFGGHKDETSRGMDKAGDMIDERTGEKYGSRIDTGVDKGKDRLGLGDERGPDDSTPA